MTSKNKVSDHSQNDMVNSQVPVTYTINQEIFNKARQTKDELTVISNRLTKLDEHQSEVSEIVFQKIKNEYLQKQNEVSEVFATCKTEIRAELKNLVDAERQNTLQLKNHQLTLEEVKLRGILGEFDDNQVREIEASENKIIDDFQQADLKIKNDMQSLEDLLGESFALSTDERLATDPVGANKSLPMTDPGLETGVIIESEIPTEYNGSENLMNEIAVAGSDDTDVVNLNDATIAVVTNENPAPVEDLSTGQHVNIEEEEATVCVQTPSPGSEDQTLEKESDESEARIIIYEQENKIGEHSFHSECRIGRTKTTDIFLKDDTVSRNHALIVRNGVEYKIFDQNSANGVIVNEERVTEATLKNEDRIIIGIFTLVFKLD
jgi:hypothetical protein